MIKIEELDKPTMYYCLNPYCSHQLTRKFTSDQKHFSLESCRKWIISQQRLLQSQCKAFAAKEMRVDLDFEEQPIQSLFKLERLSKSDWQKQLDADEAKVKRDINKSIELQFIQLKQKIEAVIQKGIILEDIRDIVVKTQDSSNEMNQYFQKQFANISQLKSYDLFNRQHLKYKIDKMKVVIQQNLSSLINQKTFFPAIFSNQQQRLFHQFIFEHSDQYFNKLQKLSAALSKSLPNYSVNNQKIILKCPLCEKTSKCLINPTNKKQARKYLAEQILAHMYGSHYQQSCLAHCRKITKTNIKNVTFEQFLEQSKQYLSVKIIDRESGINFEQNYQQLKNSLGNKNINLQIVCVKNIAMAKGRHIAVTTHEAIDYLIAIVSHACTQRGQDVEIVTKKPHLQNGLSALLWLDGKENCCVDKQKVKLESLETTKRQLSNQRQLKK